MRIKKFLIATFALLATTLIVSPSIENILPIGFTEMVYASYQIIL